MASNIVPGNIDGTYPKAGEDNSSQGFRDNFSAINTNFTEAKSEIEDQRLTKPVKMPLVTSPIMKFPEQSSRTHRNSFAHGSVSGGAVTLNHENGHYQTLT